ncbi:VWA-like domain-containing protein [Rhodopseudomonas palustris]|uniref:vWA domain-containing protein n=1 Tax=Rhodopseudomonas palustris TaxID=1076 RepID=UPI0020CCF7E4|nr:VWA-like domain-containing protein [Rhodopseudomonas palustris]MCP9627398.1 VWA-like domain-containing protein [Rhodopseudomonas palustris]
MPEAAALFSHRGTRAIQRMVEFAPSTGGLALWVRHQDLPADGNEPTSPAVTDGTTVYYSAAFDKLPLAEQAGLVAHEVLHIALRHPQRYVELQRVIGDVDLELYTICADAVVNSTLAHLTWLKLPARSVMLEQLLAQALKREQPPEAALLEWDVEKLYRAIDDRRETSNTGKQKSNDASRTGSDSDEAGSGGRNQSQSQSESAKESAEQRADGARSAKVRELGAGGARDLIPNAESQSAPEAEAEHARDWSERILRGHAGDGAFSMLRTLIADLPRTRTPWAQVLRVQLARGLARKPALTWSRPARSYIANQGRAGRHRMPFEPGFQATKNEPRLALIIDVSGSIDDRLIERFANEIETILRRQEAGLVLIIGDERVRQVEWFEPGRRFVLGEISFAGGGGTDFTPLLAEADRHKPDIAVVLTDLEGPADFKPRWPVIWAVPEANAQTTQPFGRLLTLN